LEKTWLSSQDSAQSGSTGLSGGASDSVRCARLASVNWLLSGLRRRCTAINHRTVRWCTGLSGGAPDCPVSHSQAKSSLSGSDQRRTAINHRTVRWCTGLSGEPTVGRANGRPRNLRETRGQANGQKGAPNCPVCTGQCPVRQRLRVFNGRLRQNRKEIRTRQCPMVHRTVRCARRQKARIAFLECSQRLLAALGL
jgi:hypothetical protein